MNTAARQHINELSRMVANGDLRLIHALERAMRFGYEDSRAACNQAAKNSTDPAFKCGCAHAAYEVEKRA